MKNWKYGWFFSKKTKQTYSVIREFRLLFITLNLLICTNLYLLDFKKRYSETRNWHCHRRVILPMEKLWWPRRRRRQPYHQEVAALPHCKSFMMFTMVTSDRQIWYVKIIIFKHFFGKDGKCPQNYNASILVRYLTNITTGHSVRFLGFLSKKFFSFKKQLIYHQNHY